MDSGKFSELYKDPKVLYIDMKLFYSFFTII